MTQLTRPKSINNIRYIEKKNKHRSILFPKTFMYGLKDFPDGISQFFESLQKIRSSPTFS